MNRSDDPIARTCEIVGAPAIAARYAGRMKLAILVVAMLAGTAAAQSPKCRAVVDAKVLGEAEGGTPTTCAFSLEIRMRKTLCLTGTLGKTFSYRVELDHAGARPREVSITCKHEFKAPPIEPTGPERECRAAGIAAATGRTHSECYKRLLDKLQDKLCVPGTRGKRFDYVLESDHPVIVAGREAPSRPRNTHYVCVWENKR